MQLEDGPANVLTLADGGGEGTNHWYKVTLPEGRNREVRRLFEALGVMVSRLTRTRYGIISLPPQLKRGQTAELERADLNALLKAAGLPSLDGGDAGRDDERDSMVDPDAQPNFAMESEAVSEVDGNRGTYGIPAELHDDELDEVDGNRAPPVHQQPAAKQPGGHPLRKPKHGQPQGQPQGSAARTRPFAEAAALRPNRRMRRARPMPHTCAGLPARAGPATAPQLAGRGAGRARDMAKAKAKARDMAKDKVRARDEADADAAVVVVDATGPVRVNPRSSPGNSDARSAGYCASNLGGRLSMNARMPSAKSSREAQALKLAASSESCAENERCID